MWKILDNWMVTHRWQSFGEDDVFKAAGTLTGYKRTEIFLGIYFFKVLNNPLPQTAGQ